MVEIETSHLLMQPMTVNNMPVMTEMFQDPRITRYLPAVKPLSIEETYQEVRFMEDHWEAHRFGVWAVHNRRHQEFMGYAGLQHLHIQAGGVTAETLGENNVIELVFGLNQKYWGHGNAVEAARASLRFGFQQLGLEKIIAAIHPENGPSRHILLKYLRMHPAPDLRFYTKFSHFIITSKEFRPDESVYILR